MGRTLVRRVLLGIAIFQVLSTLLGVAMMLLVPEWFTGMLAETPFADRVGLAAVLLGVVTGGWQWLAVYVHWRRPPWIPAAHLVAGTVMLGWIAGECLVLDSFAWPHALWGGAGAVQVILVAVYLGALRPHQEPPRRDVGPGRGVGAGGDAGPRTRAAGTRTGAATPGSP